MVKPVDGTKRDLGALPNLEVDVSTHNNDILSLDQDRDDGRNCRERLGVDNSIFCPKEICNIFLEAGMNVDCSVETCWTATSFGTPARDR